MIAVRVRSGLPASCAVSKSKVCPVSPVCLHSRQRARTICLGYYAEHLLPAPRFTECNQNPSITNYDVVRSDDLAAVQANFGNHTLSRNKGRLQSEESRHMDVEERDKFKDWSWDDSANATIFNMSKDLIQKTGYYWQNPYSYERISDEKFEFLKTDAGLHDAVGILNKAFDRWGIEDTLAFVRRGGDAFDPYSQYTKPDGTGSCWRNYWSAMHSAGFKPQSVYDEVVDYLSCIKKFLQYIDENEGYLTNKWRPDIHCPHLPLPGSATQ